MLHRNWLSTCLRLLFRYLWCCCCPSELLVAATTVGRSVSVTIFVLWTVPCMEKWGSTLFIQMLGRKGVPSPRRIQVSSGWNIIIRYLICAPHWEKSWFDMIVIFDILFHFPQVLVLSCFRCSPGAAFRSSPTCAAATLRGRLDPFERSRRRQARTTRCCLHGVANHSFFWPRPVRLRGAWLASY
jgi:hypothetical protein